MLTPRLSLLLAAAIVALAALGLPRQARGEAAELRYLALGDSVPSGTDVPEGVGYPRRLGQRLANETGRPIRLHNRARAGEQSDGVLAAQLDGLREVAPELVTLTVGANDFLVPTFECIASKLDKTPGDRCDLADPRRTLPRLEANLRATLARLAGETDATIAVTTYYNPFPRGSRCAPGLADLSLGVLNKTIAAVAREYGNRTVVVDLFALFRGHEGREPTGWFAPNPIRLSCSDIHPNGDGHDAIANAVWESLWPRLGYAPVST